jgi:hypothetical protein
MPKNKSPEDIVAMLGNIANRPDLRAAQESQVEFIREYAAQILEDEAAWMEAWIDVKDRDLDSVDRTISLMAIRLRGTAFKIRTGLKNE